MKLLQLTATFGCLDNETLTFDPGLTLITLPNGKQLVQDISGCEF